MHISPFICGRYMKASNGTKPCFREDRYDFASGFHNSERFGIRYSWDFVINGARRRMADQRH